MCLLTIYITIVNTNKHYIENLQINFYQSKNLNVVKNSCNVFGQHKVNVKR